MLCTSPVYPPWFDHIIANTYFYTHYKIFVRPGVISFLWGLFSSACPQRPSTTPYGEKNSHLTKEWHGRMLYFNLYSFRYQKEEKLFWMKWMQAFPKSNMSLISLWQQSWFVDTVILTELCHIFKEFWSTFMCLYMNTCLIFSVHVNNRV